MKTTGKPNNIAIEISDIGEDFSEVTTYPFDDANIEGEKELIFSSKNKNISPHNLNQSPFPSSPNANNNYKKNNNSRKKNIRDYLSGYSNNFENRQKRLKPKVTANYVEMESSTELQDYWSLFAKTVTCCVFPICLKKCGMSSEAVQMAWREKITMVFIYLFMMALTGYFTFGIQKTICQTTSNNFNPWRTINKDQTFKINKLKGPIIRGYIYDYIELKNMGLQVPGVFNNSNLNSIYLEKSHGYFKSSCKKFIGNRNTCHLYEPKEAEVPCNDIRVLDYVKIKPNKQLYTWDDLEIFRKRNNKELKNDVNQWEERPRTQEDYNIINNSNLLVFNGAVLNITNILNGSKHNSSITNSMIGNLRSLIGKDATLYISRTLKYNTNSDISCLLEQNIVGYIDKKTVGCFISQVYIYTTLVLILGVVLVRFIMAIVFRYFMAPRLFKKKHYNTNMNGPRTNLNTIRAISYHSKDVALKNSSNDTLMYLDRNMNPFDHDIFSGQESQDNEDDSADDENQELYTICLVTCYSEGKRGLRNTLNSLASTKYDDTKKLLFIIADGLIKGEGNDQLTSDIILSFISENYHQYKNPRSQMPEPQSYVSIGIGNKLKNMARVHAGTYTSLDRTHTCPVIVVVKCGNPEEANDPKPGNRGKRDSQVILMNFLNRVIFNDRMTPLDYELTYQIQKTANVFPDRYDLVLMVDADTKVKPESLNYMVKAMVCDEKIMGLCGETRVYNKTDSFITQIQVFEYYISHHLSKAFESVFGGVTCLPGCFCMYRIKSRKPNTNYIIPILANPDIIAEYSQNIVKSLHQKNLLLLGEDRFLSTLMLKTFPKRKMMFVPQARCKTIVPDTFKVLLSQRRRWINSTVHNLVKLVFVNDLCGTFCFSMQFVIFFELCGTVVLPAALCFTIYILISFIFSNTLEILPMILLLVILGLPGVLIFVTFNNWHYFLWMIIYLIALPIWNFILPLYAVWHMDDFSWGETRKISSSGYKNNSNGNGNGNDKDNDNEFSSDVTELNHTRDENKNKRVPFKHWSEYEYERLLETKPKGSSSSSLLPEQGFKGTTLSMGHALTGSSLTSTLIPLNMNSNSTMYSTLISNYNHNGGSNSKINYHDLYQRSQYTTNTELYHHFNKKNSEIDKFESIIGKSDISEIRKSDMISNTKKLHFHDKNILSSLGNDDNTTRNYNAMKNTGREHYFEMNDSSILNNIFNTNPYKNHKIDHSNINVINEYKTNNNNAKVVDHHDNYQPQIMNNFSRETRSNHGHYNDDLDMTNIRNLRNESFKYSNNNSSVRDNERDKPHYYYNQKGFQEDLYHNKEKSKDNKYPSAKVENISSRRCSRNGQYIPLNTEFNTDPKPELPKRVSSIKHGNK